MLCSRSRRSAASWRALLGAPLSFGNACALYGVGSLANTFLPGHAGDAIRIGLFGRVVPGGALPVAGTVAAVGTVRWVALLPPALAGIFMSNLPPFALGAAAVALVALPALGLLARRGANVGVAGGAAAIAFHAQGTPMHAALAAGFVLHAVETCAGVAFGATSTLALARTTPWRRALALRPTVAGLTQL